MFGADNDAGGFESHIQTMRAEMTFRGGVRLGVEINRIVRAGLHTGFTSDADAWVELDDAIIALIHRADGTDARARWIGAVITARDLKAAAHVGEGTCLHILDPCAIHAKRHLIFGLARSRAGVTADAFALVYQKSIIGHKVFHQVNKYTSKQVHTQSVYLFTYVFSRGLRRRDRVHDGGGEI